MSRLMKVAFTCAVLAFPTMAWAQGKIAVVDVQEAILQTDLSQKRLTDVRNQEDYKSDKAEFDRLKDEFDELVRKLQTDMAVMSAEQQKAARQKLATKQGDLEHVTGKLQQAEQSALAGLQVHPAQHRHAGTVAEANAPGLEDKRRGRHMAPPVRLRSR